MYGRGTLVGLTRGAGRAHIVRAALEAIAFQTADVMEAMARDSATPLSQMRADGGASANEFLMQFQADILGVPVVRPAVTETTALGAALLAGLAVGFWESRERCCAPGAGRNDVDCVGILSNETRGRAAFDKIRRIPTVVFSSPFPRKR